MEQSASDNVQYMLLHDEFSKWLGIEVIRLDAGFCCLRMIVRPDMLNGFGIAHGGICFSLADSCLAFAANSFGKISLTMKADISWPASVFAGDVLVAESRQLAVSSKSATYDVFVRKEGSDDTVALFRGLVYRTDKPVIRGK